MKSALSFNVTQTTSMTSKIKELVRKRLWASSAGRCALCNLELIDNNGISNIGQECHIISSRPKGPRYQPNLKDYNNYDNIIILCANHHREIDTNVEKYPVEALRKIKKEHEFRIKTKLTENNKKIDVLDRVCSGDVFGELIWGKHGRTVIKQSLDSRIIHIAMNLDELIGNMMDLQYCLEITDKQAFHDDLENYIKQLEDHNYSIYADTQIKTINAIRSPSIRIIIKEGKAKFLLLEQPLK